jgi:cyclopropane fatty-acyl-phospholipid synthase-like methyltransferase
MASFLDLVDQKDCIRHFIEAVVDPLPKNPVIVDIGCGDGRFALDFFSPQALFGVDNDSKKQTDFYQNIKSSGIEGKTYESVKLLYEDQGPCADVLIYVGLFELIDEATLSEVIKLGSACLKKGGSVFCLYYPWSNFSPFYAPLLLKGGRRKYEARIGTKVYSPNLKDINNLFEENGLVTEASGCINPYPSYFWRKKILRTGFFLPTKYDIPFFGGRYMVGKKT